MTKKMGEKFQARQGDVGICEQAALPPGVLKRVPREAGRIILAAGEVTGHHHAIDSRYATLWEAGDGARYLEVKRTCRLYHEEHADIGIPPGVYHIGIQREYVAPDVVRKVED